LSEPVALKTMDEPPSVNFRTFQSPQYTVVRSVGQVRTSRVFGSCSASYSRTELRKAGCVVTSLMRSP
jgi:hypothetical protein